MHFSTDRKAQGKLHYFQAKECRASQAKDQNLMEILRKGKNRQLLQSDE